MRQRLKSLSSDGVSLLAGCLLPLAFAPFHWWLLAFFSPAILLFTWLHTGSKKRSFWRGWLYGLGYFGVGVSWVYISIHVYGHTMAPIAVLLTALFVMVMALFIAVQGVLFKLLAPRNPNVASLLIFPALWVSFEWIRTWLFTGFPWLFIGYSQTTTAPLGGYAPLVGVYGVSFITLFSAGLLTLLYYSKRWFHYLTLIILLFIIGWSGTQLSTIHWTQATGQPLTISLVQGDVAQSLKWQPEQVEHIMQRYVNLTQPHWNSDLIVWPEAAVTLPLPYAKNFISQLNQLASEKNSTLITGIPIIKAKKYYNAIVTLGEGEGVYYKRHLVPFGEYVPLPGFFRQFFNFLNIPLSDLSPGPQRQPLLRTKNNITIAPFICYEIAYPGEVLKHLHHADLILTVTDDSWFGHSIAAAQHLQMAQMRARETGREVIFSTNDAITAVINSQGEIIARAPPHQQFVLNSKAQPMQGNTPLMLYGNRLVLILIFMLLGLGLFARRFK